MFNIASPSRLAAGWTQSQIDRLNEFHSDTHKDEDTYEYADNFRCARKDNAEECQDYYAIQDQGCCGFCDTVIEHPDGDILYGFNYGH